MNDDRSILLALSRNCRKAQEQVHDTYARSMTAMCTKILGKREAALNASDAVSEGFRNFYAKVRAQKGEGIYSIRDYLVQVMINQCRMIVRKAGYGELIPIDLVEYECAAGDEDPVGSLKFKEILELVDILPLGYRTVFYLHVIDGYTHEQIAVHAGIGVSTSKSQFGKARKILQQLLIKKDSSYATRIK